MSLDRDLRLMALAAVVLAAAALVVPWPSVSLVLLAPLAFFLTGQAIVAACFAGGRLPPLPQRAALSIGLSLAVLALGSLALNYVGGLHAGTWAAGLVVTVLAGCAIAARRRPPATHTAAPPTLPRPRRRDAALAGLGLLALAAAVTLAFIPVSSSHAVGFTELWLRPGTASVRVGIASEEKRTTSYRLLVSLGEGRAPLRRHVVLEPGQSTFVELPVVAASVARPALVEASLYLTGEPDTPYREVYGWVPAP